MAAFKFNWNRVGILLKAAWIPGQGCVIIETDSAILAATFIYSMVFDLVVLSLTAFKLLSPPSGRSRLVELIFNDGLIYFVIAWALFQFYSKDLLTRTIQFPGEFDRHCTPFYRFSFPHLIFNRYLCSWTSTLSCRLSQTFLLRLHLRFVSFNFRSPFAQSHHGRLLPAVSFDGWITLRRKVQRCSRTLCAPCIILLSY
jgi:hypothetical protein